MQHRICAKKRVTPLESFLIFNWLIFSISFSKNTKSYIEDYIEIVDKSKNYECKVIKLLRVKSCNQASSKDAMWINKDDVCCESCSSLIRHFVYYWFLYKKCTIALYHTHEVKATLCECVLVLSSHFSDQQYRICLSAYYHGTSR